MALPAQAEASNAALLGVHFGSPRPGSWPVVVTPSGFGDRNRADQLDHAVLAHCARLSTNDADRQKSIGAPRRRR
ncbi:hypothetical protein B2M20_01870 [Nitrobacter vulgaris]|uniref:Uncharacterized protein n=1 Tax=Nitrobacter vulgaris TaxID=29421 RepID=A0A1V4I229_NITVU|nr:hypothetical protein B2M20_01870 [Nitrobacter vulgaris]